VVPSSFQPSGQVQSITAQTHGAQQNVVPGSFQPSGQTQSITSSLSSNASASSAAELVRSVQSDNQLG
ncbi:hypothetical protein, partial [Paenibacillus dendritiformis]|uniref:hypothetical protein n=1 Tax=Paenibacillus dendritiformis TaxID=130049 RepID=UPI00387E0E16